MEFTKKDPFIKQIALYVQNQEFERAYELSRDFTVKFPNELTSHFLLAKTAFRLKKFADAIAAGRKAFNLASTKEDMLASAVVLSSSYFMSGARVEAYKVLRSIDGEGNTDAERLMFIYALSVQNAAEATEHLDRLYKINRRAAEEFMKMFF